MLTSALEARVGVRPAAAHGALPLPLPCTLDILSRLTPGERLLSSAVSRAWRAAVGQPPLWRNVDLGEDATDALLAAVVAKAAGKITSLRLYVHGVDVSIAAVLAAVAATAGALRQLDLRSSLSFDEGFEEDWVFVWKDQVDEMLHAATGLVSFEADVRCNFEEAQALLPGQGQYSVVRIRRLVVGISHGGRELLPSIQDATSLARGLCLHPSLQELGILDIPFDTPAVLGALVDAVIACGLSAMRFSDCSLGPQSAPHLARLLRDAPRLQTLLIDGDDLFDAARVRIFAAALRATSLTVLHLSAVKLWKHDGVGNVLVDALVVIRRSRRYRWIAILSNLTIN